MPYTKDGVRADLVMDPTSLASRMNLGRSYEIYFNASTRKARELIRESIMNHPGDVETPWKLVLEFLSILDTEQYVTYQNATHEEKVEVLNEIATKEFFVLYRISSEKKPHVVVQELEKSKFAPLKETIYIPKPDGTVVETKSPMIIGPLYSILLNKTPDDGLITASSGKTNHFGLPAGSGTQKYAYAYRGYSVKFLSETEARHYICNGSLELAAEIKDRANSIETHRLMYKNILKSDTPGFSKTLIDRKEHKFGTDISLKILHSILNVAGLEIVYRKDPLDGFHPMCDPRIGFNGPNLVFETGKKDNSKKK